MPGWPNSRLTVLPRITSSPTDIAFADPTEPTKPPTTPATADPVRQLAAQAHQENARAAAPGLNPNVAKVAFFDAGTAAQARDMSHHSLKIDLSAVHDLVASAVAKRAYDAYLDAGAAARARDQSAPASGRDKQAADGCARARLHPAGPVHAAKPAKPLGPNRPMKSGKPAPNRKAAMDMLTPQTGTTVGSMGPPPPPGQPVGPSSDPSMPPMAAGDPSQAAGQPPMPAQPQPLPASVTGQPAVAAQAQPMDPRIGQMASQLMGDARQATPFQDDVPFDKLVTAAVKFAKNAGTAAKVRDDKLVTAAAKSAWQDNRGSRFSATGEGSHLGFDHKPDGYAKGPAAWKSLGRYLKNRTNKPRSILGVFDIKQPPSDLPLRR